MHFASGVMTPNEKEVSYRHRERAGLEVKIFWSCKNANARRVAVSSTDWLDGWREYLMKCGAQSSAV